MFRYNSIKTDDKSIKSSTFWYIFHSIIFFFCFFRLDVVSQVGRWPCPRLVLAPAGGSLSRSADGVYHAICITQGSSSSSSRLFFLFLYRKSTRNRRSCCTSGERPRAALSSSSSSSSLSRQLHQHIQQQRRSEFFLKKKRKKVRFFLFLDCKIV